MALELVNVIKHSLLPILINIACLHTFGTGALTCDAEKIIKCRAILTNPRTLTTGDSVTDTYGCGNEDNEFSYGGCHVSCRSCVETYVRSTKRTGP